MGDYNDPFMRNRDATVQARAKAQNRATVLQLKLIGQSHPTGLTTNLLKLFEPRHPLEYKPPPEKRKCLPYTGMAQFVSSFAEPGQPEYAPPVQEGETPAQRRARIHSLRLEKGAIKAGEELQKYDPSKDLNISGDPYKTLFVARLSYETTEHRIKREFEAYGPIKRVGILEHPQGGAQVRMITDKDTNKPRGYAFVEYLHTRDMKTAYKQADGRKLDNRRVLVDVERGRTVPNWRPRRLGGGLGSTRVGGEEVNQRYSGREPQQIISGAPRSEEPRAREDRHVDREREKSRERGRDREREREKSRERSHDKIRDRDPREERHHRDRDRRERERNRGWDRDHDRTRDHDRERGRDRDRDRERGRDRDRDRDRDYDHDRGRDRDHQRSREREREYDRGDRERTRDREGDHDYVEPRREREHAGERDREYEFGEPERDREWFDEHVEPEHGYERDEHVDPERGYEHHDPGQVYDHLKPEKSYDHVKPERERERDRYEHLEPEHDRELYDRRDPDRDHEQHERAEPDSDNRRYDRAESEPRERARDREKEEYNRSKRSISREYER